MRLWLGSALCLATLSLSSSAFAESEGERLFREGKLALANGLYEEACAKFERSHKVEGAVGPLLNQADCEERRGKLVKAVSLWKQGAQKATSSDDQSFIAGRVSSLEGRIPTVTFELGPEVPPETKVTLDGEAIELGKPVTLDPGDHALVAKAADKVVVEKTLKVDERQRLKEIIAPQVVVTEPGTGGGSDGPNEGLLIGGLVAMGVGAAGIVGFAVTGGLVIGKHDEWETNCTGGNDAPNCADLASSGNSLNLANGLMAGVAAAGAATGTVLLILAYQGGGDAPSADAPPKTSRAHVVPYVVPSPDGVTIGAWTTF